MKSETLQKLIKFLMTYLTSLEYIGLEYIPKEGAILITTNHLSRIDIPLLPVIQDT